MTKIEKIPEVVADRMCDEFEAQWSVDSANSILHLAHRFRQRFSPSSSRAISPANKRLERNFVIMLLGIDIDQRKLRKLPVHLRDYSNLRTEFEWEVMSSVFHGPADDHAADADHDSDRVVVGLINELMLKEVDEPPLALTASTFNTCPNIDREETLWQTARLVRF